MSDGRPAYGTPVFDAPVNGPETLMDAENNADYRDAEKPIGSLPTRRRAKGTRDPK